ncbi:SAM-dependent methyltransferase [Nocardia sp. NPDC050630]|uniref:SAM-dependent methyltransferase n=1 Tax=Nocardia sp. NPDC050630 TaxID=3364321 RepID=UPI00379E5887
MTAPASVLPRTPVGIRPAIPNSARIWNYLLGGKDNYMTDQNVAERMRAVAPDMNRAAWYHRRFLLRAVENAARAGVRQFIDIGAGLPLGGHEPHEVAQKIQPEASFTAVDHDPMVFTHCNAMYNHRPNVHVLKADLRDVDAMIEGLRSLVDFDEPVAVLMVGVLDYVMDDEDPVAIMAQLRSALAPGSYLALTHACISTDFDLKVQIGADLIGSTAETVWRHWKAIAKFLDGFDVLPPGLRPVQEWLDGDLPRTQLDTLAAIARTD